MSVTGSSAERKGRQAFFFVADSAAGTYRTLAFEGEPADNAEIRSFMEENAERLKAEAAVTKARARKGATRRAPVEGGLRPRGVPARAGPQPLIPEGDPCPCDTPCDGTGTTVMTAYDPAFIPLTATTAYASWWRYGLFACLWRFSGLGSCWANPQTPAPLNTHWFVTGCWQDGPYGSVGETSGGYVDLIKWGSYINWDFGFDSVPSGADQMARIGVQAGSGIFYQASHYDWGEADFLIFGSLDISFENSCF